MPIKTAVDRDLDKLIIPISLKLIWDTSQKELVYYLWFPENIGMISLFTTIMVYEQKL